MGLFNAISNWQAKRFEQHRSEMEALDKCPDCKGRGFSFSAYVEDAVPNECAGCNGSGLYSDWAEENLYH